MHSALLALWLTGAPPLPAEPPQVQSTEGLPDAGTPEMQRILNDTMTRLARRSLEEGIKDERAGKYPAALEHLRQAYSFNPADPDVTLWLGRLHLELGNPVEAESFFRQTLQLNPGDGDTHLLLATVLGQSNTTADRLLEASALLTRARELRGNDPLVIAAQARLSVAMGDLDGADRFFSEVMALRPNNELRLQYGDFLLSTGRDDEAVNMWGRVRGDAEEVARARERIRKLEVERQARRFGWTRPSREIPPRARTLESRARQLVKDRRLPEAELLLQEAVQLAPQFTAARLALGDVLRATGRVQGAELEYLRALSFDPNSDDVLFRLGDMFLQQYEPPRAQEAAVYLARALQVRPDRNEWNLSLARALRLSGDLPGALQRVNILLAGTAPEADRREAQLLKATLQKLLPHADETRPDAPEEAPLQRLALADQLNRARAYIGRGESDAAVTELMHIPPAQQTAEVRTLMGRIMHGAGRLAESAEAFSSSLSLDANQPDVHLQLGIIRMEQGRMKEAHAHLERAVDLGEPEAAYHLARLEMGLWAEASEHAWDLKAYRHLLNARNHAKLFLASAPDTALREDAEAMLDRALRDALLRLAPLLLLLAALLVVLYRHLAERYGGLDLKGLIALYPETGPEVQRILASIRHEVLKHNTMVLSGLVEAMERGQDVRPHAQHLHETLFGHGEEAVFGRLRGYEATLQQLARAHGVRLNLQHKDKALSAIHRGFSLLRRADALRRAPPSRWRRAWLTRTFRRAANLLNTEGYEAVRGLLDELRVLRVDEALLRSIHARTCREPAIKALHPLPLDLEVAAPLPLGVCLPRGALEDILQNLFRNAFQASVRARVVPQVGLRVDTEVNPITGHERVRFMVRDRSPAVLDLTTILQQSVEGGLGITVQLVNRYDGTVDVSGPEGGWQKSVVVKLPLEELMVSPLPVPPEATGPTLEAPHV